MRFGRATTFGSPRLAQSQHLAACPPKRHTNSVLLVGWEAIPEPPEVRIEERGLPALIEERTAPFRRSPIPECLLCLKEATCGRHRRDPDTPLRNRLCLERIHDIACESR